MEEYLLERGKLEMLLDDSRLDVIRWSHFLECYVLEWKILDFQFEVKRMKLE